MIETTASKSFAESAEARGPGSAGAAPAVSRAPRDTLGEVARPVVAAHGEGFFGEAPKTAGGAPALPGKNSPLTWLNLVCLDAPVVAVSWLGLFAHSFGLTIAAAETAALFLTGWLIYLSDRLGDSVAIGEKMPTSLRQRFCREHPRAWLVALGAVAVVDLVVISSIGRRTFLTGAAIGALAVLYLMVNRGRPSLWRTLPLKEVIIGFLFATGTMVPLAHDFTPEMVTPALFFPCLCALNCISIAVWERSLDEAQGRISIATAFPAIARFLLAMLMILAVASLASGLSAVQLSIAVSGALLAALHICSSKLQSDVRTALADLVLLTPIVAMLAPS